MQQRRNTKQRDIILDAVLSRCDHPSAQQIYEQVRTTDSHISQGTVYRNLSLLAEDGKIQQVRLADADRFDLTLTPHCHFVCKCCGSVSDVDLPYELKFDGRITEGGYEIDSHQTVFYGLCPQCRK